jgi:hypothetical protein
MTFLRVFTTEAQRHRGKLSKANRSKLKVIFSNQHTFALSTRQNFMETCRVRFTHRRELTINGIYFNSHRFWCAQRTLQMLFRVLAKSFLCLPASVVQYSYYELRIA